MLIKNDAGIDAAINAALEPFIDTVMICTLTALPNIVGLYLLAPTVKRELQAYQERVRA